MSTRTKRKNLRKRRKRRLFAAIAEEIQASEKDQWTPEKEELEQMRNEEQRQRTHEKWQKAVEKSTVAFKKRRKILAQRQQLILSLRQIKEDESLGGPPVSIYSITLVGGLKQEELLEWGRKNAHYHHHVQDDVLQPVFLRRDVVAAQYNLSCVCALADTMVDACTEV
ncbi:unnamed protein product [Peronospora belbahrii]|uniref:SAM-dependent MTase TRM10-type domain-containing protein n=1 Tax=Peronospora belbahrii TaxID=622444 RepID=A0ABN8DCE9_9STRA|nr:unnamed protein product [Peronospora belbahrii]